MKRARRWNALPLFYHEKGIRMKKKTRMRLARMRKGYSQKELAEIADIHPTIISGLEIRTRVANKKYRERISHAVDVPADVLFQEDGLAAFDEGSVSHGGA